MYCAVDRDGVDIGQGVCGAEYLGCRWDSLYVGSDQFGGVRLSQNISEGVQGDRGDGEQV